MVTLRVLPQAAAINPTGDVAFEDVILKECRVTSVPTERSQAGQTWTVQLHDRRWRWQYGYISGRYNPRVSGQASPDITGEEATAQDLATYLLEEMKLAGGYSLGDLPADQYPEVVWDYANPAQELQTLCDLFGLVVAYDPVRDRVELLTKGEGAQLNQTDKSEKHDVTVAPPNKPAKLLGVAEKDEHEFALELEAVGQDTDGQIKPLSLLSYTPGAGWSDLPEDLLTDDEQLAVAVPSVFMWYRLKPTHNLAVLGAKKRHEILPIVNRLVDNVVEIETGEDNRTKHRPSYVAATVVEDPESVAHANTDRYISDGFQVDEARGLVMFNRPIYAWSGGYMVAATCTLRCTVMGDRYEKERALGGAYGDRVVFVPNAVRTYRNGVCTNQAAVDREIDAVLTRVAKEYEAPPVVQATYIGIVATKCDGAIHQVSYHIGADGATTSASRNAEHANVPLLPARRAMEKAARDDRETRKLPQMCSLTDGYRLMLRKDD